MARGRRGGDFRPVEAVAAAAGSLLPQRRQGRHLQALAAWRAAVGEKIRAATRVRGLEAGTLTVEVPDLAWEESLRALEGTILSRVRGPLGRQAPRHIEFRVSPGWWRPPQRPSPLAHPRARAGGTAGGAQGPGSPPVQEAVTPEGPPRILESDLPVRDPHLRRELCRLGDRYLRRGERRR